MLGSFRFSNLLVTADQNQYLETIYIYIYYWYIFKIDHQYQRRVSQRTCAQYIQRILYPPRKDMQYGYLSISRIKDMGIFGRKAPKNFAYNLIQTEDIEIPLHFHR